MGGLLLKGAICQSKLRCFGSLQLHDNFKKAFASLGLRLGLKGFGLGECALYTVGNFRSIPLIVMAPQYGVTRALIYLQEYLVVPITGSGIDPRGIARERWSGLSGFRVKGGLTYVGSRA